MKKTKQFKKGVKIEFTDKIDYNNIDPISDILVTYDKSETANYNKNILENIGLKVDIYKILKQDKGKDKQFVIIVHNYLSKFYNEDMFIEYLKKRKRWN